MPTKDVGMVGEHREISGACFQLKLSSGGSAKEELGSSILISATSRTFNEALLPVAVPNKLPLSAPEVILLRFSANGPLVGPAEPSDHRAPFHFPQTPRSPAVSIFPAISADTSRPLAGTPPE